MLDSIMQILSVIGSILLVLMIILLVLLLLVLFYPITYRFYGAKQEEIVLKAKVNWLLGLFRVHYAYPEPGRLTVKFLWMTLADKKIPGSDETKKDTTSEPVKNKRNNPAKDKADADTSAVQQSEDSSNISTQITEVDGIDSHPENNAVEYSDLSFAEKIYKKIEQIKYTILSVCDKIKKIWENIHYYIELIKEDSTKALFSHVMMRLGNILKSIRPRHLKTDIVFGTGSPDTTGYVYALYGILMSALGPKCIVIPDFEQAILKGEVQFSGHISIWVLLWNGLKIFFDQKLHLFIKKMKAGLPQKDSKESEMQNKAKR